MYSREVLDKVKALIVEKGFTALAASIEMGISDQQIRRWSRRYGWMQQQEAEKLKQKIMLLGLATSKENVMADFEDFLSFNFPDTLPQIKEPIKQYLNQFIV